MFPTPMRRAARSPESAGSGSVTPTRLILSAVFALGMLTSCKEESATPASAGAPPPAEVGVVTAARETVPVVAELPGRIAATRIAEVRPRVGGIVLERSFEQGADVKEGDPLFRIDPATFEVEVEAARAGVARAEAVLLQARQAAARSRSLAQRNTVSEASLETAVALERQAEADLSSARAQLRAAQLNLDYATVRAPISGRIGRALVTEGALVSTAEAQPLATIQQLDPVYADIQQPVADLLRLRAALRDGTLVELEPDVAQVRLRLDDGSLYPHPGRLLFSEATVDATSGQVTLRAAFPNPDGTLLPGLYVRVSVEQGIDRNAIAVPDQAIQRSGDGSSSLLVVGGEGVAEMRPVVLGRAFEGRTVVLQGLAEGERVIVDGLQKIGPGSPVAPVPWAAPGAAAAPATATPAAADAPAAPAPAPTE